MSTELQPQNLSATDSVWYQDVPRSVSKLAIFGIVLMALSLGGFSAWAFRAPLAAAVIAQGSFVATGRNKIVQHLEGGIIKEIAVREGDVVKAGDLILSLDKTAVTANERELELRRLRLEANEARLLAEYNQKDQLVFSEELMLARADFEVATILDSQLLGFKVSQNALENDIALLRGNKEALDIRAAGYAAQLEGHRMQIELLSEEYDDKNKLFDRGLVRRPEINALKRAIIDAQGQVGRLEAEIAEIVQMQSKYLKQIEKTIGQYRQGALDELQAIQSELDSIREQSRTAQSVSARTDVVAPVDGTVVRMYYHTSGGVVETGKAIAEILPAEEPLIIEVQVPRVEIDSVGKGQPATVRLTALNQRTTPILDGEVYYVSADAVTDNTSGAQREVYLARISLSPEQILRVGGFSPTPGMPVEIMIQTETRTFAQYLAKPVVDSMSRAFREQ